MPSGALWGQPCSVGMLHIHSASSSELLGTVTPLRSAGKYRATGTSKQRRRCCCCCCCRLPAGGGLRAGAALPEEAADARDGAATSRCLDRRHLAGSRARQPARHRHPPRQETAAAAHTAESSEEGELLPPGHDPTARAATWGVRASPAPRRRRGPRMQPRCRPAWRGHRWLRVPAAPGLSRVPVGLRCRRELPAAPPPRPTPSRPPGHADRISRRSRPSVPSAKDGHPRAGPRRSPSCGPAPSRRRWRAFGAAWCRVPEHGAAPGGARTGASAPPLGSAQEAGGHMRALSRAASGRAARARRKEALLEAVALPSAPERRRFHTLAPLPTAAVGLPAPSNRGRGPHRAHRVPLPCVSVDPLCGAQGWGAARQARHTAAHAQR